MKLIRPLTIGPLALVISTWARWWLKSADLRLLFEDPAADPNRAAQRGIYVFWHEMMFFPLHSHRHQRAAVMVSRHRDGELLARVLRMLGFGVVRGSTTRQGLSAVRGMLRQGKVRHLVMTPDGPRGPRRVAQHGAVYIASRTGMPLHPVGFAFRDCWRVRSWDSTAFPKLFTSGYGVFAKPMTVPPDLTRGQIEEYRLRLQAELDRVQARAEAMASAPRPAANSPAIPKPVRS